MWVDWCLGAVLTWTNLLLMINPPASIRNYEKSINTTKKKTHPWQFGPNEFFSCHAYDTYMMIIVTIPGIIIDVVGSYFYDKKSWQKWAFRPGRDGDTAAWYSLGRPWQENRGRSEGEENIGVFPVTVGGRGRAMRVYLVSYARGCEALGSNWTRVRRWALTKSERLHCRLHVTEPERSINP